MKIDHIGIAVKSLGDAVASYEGTLGLNVSGYDQVNDQGVRVAMVPLGDTQIELLEPTTADSPVGKFIARRGEGIHHIAVRVDDIGEALERFKAAGARLIDDVPREGAHNTKVAFIHPASMHGVLLELVEHGE
jgi:methylmalonyl-CoA/ethylmalonyl-CoA epimerase